MKKNLLFLRLIFFGLVMLFSSGWVMGQTLLLNENFTGTVGTALTANGWVLHSGTATPILISTPGLNYGTYMGSGVGNAATTGGTSDDVNRAFTSKNSGSLYMSFLFKPT